MSDYARHCNEFYFLTADEKVYNSAKEWAREIEHPERKNVGVLLYDKDKNRLRGEYKPIKVKKEVCKETLIRARMVNMVRVNEEDSTPKQVIQKVVEVLENEFNISDLMQK